MIDLDSITVDPLDVVNISKETNKALAQNARQMQAENMDILKATAELRNLTTTQRVADIELDTIAAKEQGDILAAAEEVTSNTRQGEDAVRATLAQKMNELNELNNQLATKDLGFIQKWRLGRQRDKVDNQAGVLYKSLLATNMVQNQVRQQAGLEAKLSQDRTMLAKQANDEIHNVERTLRLADKIEQQSAKIAADSAVVEELRKREKVDPEMVRRGKDENAMKDVLEYMYYLRNGTSEGYNDAQSKAMRVIFETMQDDASRRGIMLGSTEYLKGKLTGVQLTPDEYVQHFMQNGEINGLKAAAILREDTDMLDSIALGEQKVFENIYNRKIEAATAELKANNPDPMAQLTSQQQRDIYNQSMAEIESMNARDIMGAAQNAISQEISASTTAAGGQIYSRISESPSQMLAPQNHSAEMRGFFETPEVKQALAIPDQRDGTPLISTAAKLVELARKQVNYEGKPAFSDQEIYSAVADLTKNAAMANYKYGQGVAGRGPKAIQSLETAGVRFEPKLLVEMPSVRKIRAPGQQPVRLDMFNRVDLQKAIEELSAVRKKREEDARQPKPQVKTSGFPVF